jgi:hypothetical protein
VTVHAITDITSRNGYRPDMPALARAQLRAARESLGLDYAGFAAVLAPLLGYTPAAAVMRGMETAAVPPGDVLLAAGVAAQQGPASGDSALSRLMAGRYCGVTAVYATRSEFAADLPPAELLAGAQSVRASGLCLNLLCQQAGTGLLRNLIEGGTDMQCLFLEPGSAAIRAREAEEGYDEGVQSAQTTMNLGILAGQVGEHVSAAARPRLQIATTSETLRFNLLFAGDIAVIQPYLPDCRGLDSPVFVTRRQQRDRGLWDTFSELFTQMWARSREFQWTTAVPEACTSLSGGRTARQAGNDDRRYPD